MTKKTGGPAFPAPNYICDSARIDKDAFQKMGLTQGMTLRDYFAGQFLMGNATHGVTDDDTLESYLKKCSVMAYKMSDAMLAARKDSDEAKAE